MLNVARKFINSSSLNLLVSLFVFLFVFFTPLDTSLNKYGGNYVHSTDTSAYFRLILDPWKTIRTPGYPLFLNLFFEPHREQFENVLKSASKLPWGEVYGWGKRFPEFVNAGGMQGVFDNIVLCQKLLLSFGAAFLVFTCSLYFNALVVGGCFYLGVQITPLFNTAYLLTESLAQPLSFFVLAFLLLFHKKKNFLLLFMAALCSSYLYLVRPAGIYMIALCGLVWIYSLWKTRFRHISKFLLCFTGFLPAVAYISYISFTSGHLMFGTYPESSDLQFACYFLQKEDIDNMPTVRSREYARLYLDKIDAWKEKNGERCLGRGFEHWPTKRSFGFQYSVTAWNLAHYTAPMILAELAKNPQIGTLNLQSRVNLGRELKQGMLKRHTQDFIKTVARNVLTGIGYYRDYRSSAMERYGFPCMLGAWGVWLCAMVVCPPVRFCLFLLGATHLLHLFAISYGNFILSRYVNLTETLFAFAVFLSLWALGARILQLINKVFEGKGVTSEAYS